LLGIGIKQGEKTEKLVRELIEDGTVKIEFVRSENNDSDIFTKNLGKELFTRRSEKFMKFDIQKDKFPDKK
jgi:16S rRNA U1498 N3-methylase RsmE